MAKPSRNPDRRARVEALRREAQRAERRRTLVVLAGCAVVALVIASVTGYVLLTRDDGAASAGSAGPGSAGAGCGAPVSRGADAAGDHRAPGTTIDYPYSPPAFGPHWPVPADASRTFYSGQDRPAVEQLVHNLEHGYTIVWYDQSIAGDPGQLATMRSIAAPYEGRSDQSGKLIVAPWTPADGAAFPEGKHVALTHWSAQGGGAIAGQGRGDWLYCSAPSQQVVTDFMREFPYSNAPEPNGA